MPVGNGRLGGMVYGGVTSERIALNEDTLWSGGPKNCDNPEALKTLPEIRRLIFEGKYAEPTELGKKMMGPYTQTYLPMGDLVLTFDTPSSSGPTEVRDYRRMLDLDRGVAACATRSMTWFTPGRCSSRNPTRCWLSASRQAGREALASRPGWAAGSISAPRPRTTFWSFAARPRRTSTRTTTISAQPHRLCHDR